MKTKQFTRDEFKAQCLLIGIALQEAPEMDMEDVAERFTEYHYGAREYDEARAAVRGILRLDPGPVALPAGAQSIPDTPTGN